MIGGAWNEIDGKIYQESSSKKPLYTFSGFWDRSITFTKVSDKSKQTIDLSKPNSEWSIPDEEDLDERTSEILWKQFREYHTKGDLNAANKVKHELEEEQRARKKNGTDWEPEFFVWQDNDWVWNGEYPKFYQQ